MGNLFRVRIQTEYFRFLIGRNRRFMILMSSAMLVLYPVLVLTIMSFNNFSTPNYELFQFGQVFALLLLLASCFLVPLLLFSYMNNKKDLDVYHALPIKREQLLLTTGWAGYVILLIPFIVTWLTGGVLASVLVHYSLITTLQSLLTIMLISSSIYMIVLFTMMNTGTTLDAFLYSCVLHFLPILIYGTYLVYSFSVLLGYNADMSWKILSFISPIWALFEAGLRNTNLLWNPMAYGLYWGIIAVILSQVDSLIYKNRKSEKAETPFTNQWFFPIVSNSIAVLILVFLYCFIYNIIDTGKFLSLQNLFFPVLFSGVLYLVMDVIAHRNFRNLVRALISYILVMVVTFLMFLPASMTGGFGYVTRVPKLANITSVDLKLDDYQGIITQQHGLEYSSTTNGYEPSSILTDLTNGIMKFEKEEDIKTILAFHQIILKEYKWVDYTTKNYFNNFSVIEVIENKPNYTPSYESYPFDLVSNNTIAVTITYHLKDGNTLKRNYNVSYVWTKSLMNLSNSGEMLRKSSPLVANTDKMTFSEVRLYDALRTTSVSLPNFDFKTFATLYIKDTESLTDQQALFPGYTTKGYLYAKGCLISSASTCATDTIVIDARYRETIAWLNAQGINFAAPDLEGISSVLILPEPTEKNSYFFTSLGIQSTNYNYKGGATDPGNLTYVKLSSDQIKAILPFISNKGVSGTPLPVLLLDYTGRITKDTGSMYITPQDTSLIQSSHLLEVLQIVKDNPRYSTNTFSFFAN